MLKSLARPPLGGERQQERDGTVRRRTPPGVRGGEAGFTLLELLVVIAILGLLIGLVAPSVLRQLGGAKLNIARQSIERIGSILDLYKLDVGSYPSTDQGLQALVTRPGDAENWNGPYVKSNQVPLDPWNHPFIYRNPSNRPDHDYDLCSAGPNGNAAGGSGELCNK
ncbi:type II secretion system major pseudopilin GspG [Rhizosaccharibacter radicis]|uniref:Type II secretion system core protein G n=1 Tax=Rhizosaccharibacter radicis TaxID=2782605 RepID=A0ABT1VU87_9PROT|nr:type II secretion system major pseudopilin GspG [Acetobacteraceae bacterium KSS12]